MLAEYELIMPWIFVENLAGLNLCKGCVWGGWGRKTGDCWERAFTSSVSDSRHLENICLSLIYYFGSNRNFLLA